MTKIPTWRMKELKKEYALTLRVVESLKDRISSKELPLPTWRIKELKKELAIKIRVANGQKELIEAGVYGA